MVRLISAAAVVVVLIGFSWLVKAVNSRFAPFPRPASQGVIGASFADGEPTAWAISLAAGKSPESLDALLDRQRRQSNAEKAPPSVHPNASPAGESRNTVP
jgi:hypothetical protein